MWHNILRLKRPCRTRGLFSDGIMLPAKNDKTAVPVRLLRLTKRLESGGARSFDDGTNPLVRLTDQGPSGADFSGCRDTRRTSEVSDCHLPASSPGVCLGWRMASYPPNATENRQSNNRPQFLLFFRGEPNEWQVSRRRWKRPERRQWDRLPTMPAGRSRAARCRRCSLRADLAARPKANELAC